MSELFWPTNQCKFITTKFCNELAVGVTNTLVTELKYASKATFEYLLAANGQYCQAVIDKGEEMVTHGLCANNDPSEGNFVTFTDILCSGGHINLSSASDIGRMQYNKDMVQCHIVQKGRSKVRQA
jgi:hypothetical protein